MVFLFRRVKNVASGCRRPVFWDVLFVPVVRRVERTVSNRAAFLYSDVTGEPIVTGRVPQRKAGKRVAIFSHCR